jgi:FdhD protein
MPNQRIHGLEVIKVDKEDTNFAFDSLAVEEPLEIQIEFGAKKNRVRNSISVTMRTPQHDSDLAIGFLFTEGIIASYKQSKYKCDLSCFRF